MEANDVKTLNGVDLQARLGTGEPIVLLDVREDRERSYAKIPVPPGVVDLHIPLGQIPARFSELAGVGRDVPLVVYCHHGQRSMAAATWLHQQGVRGAANLDGGIDAWSLQVDRSIPRY